MGNETNQKAAKDPKDPEANKEEDSKPAATQQKKRKSPHGNIVDLTTDDLAQSLGLEKMYAEAEKKKQELKKQKIDLDEKKCVIQKRNLSLTFRMNQIRYYNELKAMTHTIFSSDLFICRFFPDMASLIDCMNVAEYADQANKENEEDGDLYE